MNQQERRQFVRDHRTAVFGYGRAEHGPAMTVVYYVIDGDEILVSTMAERGKAKAVRRDPRVSLCVLDENWPLEYLQVYGTATLDDDFDSAADVLRRVVDVMAGETMPNSTRASIDEWCATSNGSWCASSPTPPSPRRRVTCTRPRISKR